MVPPSQEMATMIDSTVTVKTSIIKLDSIRTSNQAGLIFLGSIINPIIGRTTVNAWSTYVPQEFPEDKYPAMFGTDPTLDSMIMILNFSAVKGDTTNRLHVSVHEIIDTTLHYYQSYYSNFRGANHYNPQPLVEFDLSGGVQHKVAHLPRTYFKELFVADRNPVGNFYFSDSIFIEKFKGFYFKVTDVSSGIDGAMYQLNMATSTLQLHYHNKNTVPDTTFANFYFHNVNRTRNVNFFTVNNDYSFANVSQGGVDVAQINDTVNQVPVCYVSGMAGLGAHVVIDTVRLNALRQTVIAAGYNRIAVQRAAIRWHLIDPAPKTYTWTPLRLCLYYDYVTGKPVPDYDPVSENTPSMNFQSDIGGYINRSNGYYEQVITSTIQRLLNREPQASNKVQLYPSTTEMVNYGYVALGGSNSLIKAPTMVLVYTMVR